MMAERFGGPYSPDGKPATGPAEPAVRPLGSGGMRRSRLASRARMLYAAPVIILINAFRSDPANLVPGLVAFGTLILAAWLTGLGVQAQAAFDARTIARRPAIPRKLFGSALTFVGLMLAGTLSQTGLLIPLGFGCAGALLHMLAFGPDPLRNKGMQGVDDFQNQRVALAVDEGEKYLAAMKDAGLRAGDSTLDARLDRFSATVRSLFRTVENDPRDLTAARKYLGVYLMGARDATVKFADHYAATKDSTARTSYLALLDDLEAHFATNTKALLDGNRTGLDIEIDVLRERLAREG